MKRSSPIATSRVTSLVSTVWNRAETGLLVTGQIMAVTVIGTATRIGIVGRIANRGRRDLDHCCDLGSCDQGPPHLDACGQYGGRRDKDSPGRSLRPDLRCRPFLPGVICVACKHTGHEATSCNMLAIALFVECHKDQLSKTKKLSI